MYTLVSLFLCFIESHSLCPLQHNCDPRFFTTVVFYKGSVSMATQLKFEVFDVYDRRESQMCPIGQSQCQVQDLVQTQNQRKRLEILFDGAVCGYLTAHVLKVKKKKSPVCVYSSVEPCMATSQHLLCRCRNLLCTVVLCGRKCIKCMQICSLYNTLL